MNIENALAELVAALENDRTLEEPRKLRVRFEALDRLDANLLHEERFEAGLLHRAAEIRRRLGGASRKLYDDIRRDVQLGTGQARLVEWMPDALEAACRTNCKGYDHLDELIGGVLQIGEPSAETKPLESEMIAYQPTPARHIFDFVSKAGLTERDCLMDLGSGLGQVALMAAICSAANCIGIELEPAYVECAQKCALSLNLNNAKFVQGDVRAADLSAGTIFYLYTPFRGAILRDVLNSLRQESARREIRICTFGPCTQVVAEEAWLRAGEAIDADRIIVFQSRA